MGSVTTIVIVDDHKAVRDSLRWLLEVEPTFNVVGESATGSGVTELVDQLHPDVLILDLGLPDMNGLDVLRNLGTRTQHTRVIILSMHATNDSVASALDNGAQGYVLKEDGAAELTRAIYEVLDGRRYLSPVLRRADN